MNTGTKISGLAHVGLIGLAVFGGAFPSDPLPFEVQEVSVITSEQFNAILAAQQSPQTPAQPAALSQPEVETDTPDLPQRPMPAPEADATPPEAVIQPESDPAPEVLPQPLPPQPDTNFTETVPQPEPPTEQAVVVPLPEAPRPEPRPVDRVAPQPVAPPPPDATPDEVVRDEVATEDGAPTEQETQEATAPEEAADRIVTEADAAPALAPTASPRPPSARPEPPATATATAPEAAEPDQDAATGAAVAAALAEALGTAGTAEAAPSGPPLTSGERDALRVSVSRCWNVGSLSSAALNTTVVVAVSLTQTGTPETGSIRMLSSSGGDDTAARQAFEAARRAIIGCGASGYDLPAEKYGQWRDIEMTFNPERMRIR